MSWKDNSYILATLTTIVFVIVLAGVKILAGDAFTLPGMAGGAVVFWVGFFLADRYFKKRHEKKKS